MPEGNPVDDLSSLIRWPREERNLEFKKSMNWADAATKAKLTKAVLAMANLRDGGHIVLGIERQGDDTYLPVGVEADHLDSFVQDQLSSHFSEYADPYVEVTLFKHSIDGKTFCIIRVSEFTELPVVCKKDGSEKLRRGAMYIRSRRIAETVEVPSQVEMREILDLAIEKRSRAFALQAERMGMVRSPKKNELADQLKKLPETEIMKRIWSMARWRVWIRPTVFEKARFQSLAACRLFVVSNAVSAGGWQYPPANDKGIDEGDEWVSGEVDLATATRTLFLAPYVERWTLFRSGQFVYNFALAEEFLGTEAWPPHPQFFIPGEGKRYLNILRTLMIVTCIYEFAARMASHHLLDPMAAMSIELHGMDGRELSFMSPERRLDERYWCKVERIDIERSMSTEALMTKARELALDVTLEIFRQFGWLNPPRNLFAEEQAKLLPG